MTHIYPHVFAVDVIPTQFDPLKTPFVAARLPPLPRILNPHLNAAARDPIPQPNQVPSVMELALLGDTVLKTLIIERIQNLASCGVPRFIARLSSLLNENNLFSYLCISYDLIDLRNRGWYPYQKAYADVFEAYIGALWRESGDMGRGRIRKVVWDIFSPTVFPILAAWQAGQKAFPAVWTTRAIGKSKLRELKARARSAHVGPSKELAIGRQEMTRPRRDRRLRAKSPSMPLQPPKPIIDLTVDDEIEVDSDDDESVIFLSESEWREINAAVELEATGWPNAEASRSQTPIVFVDTEPSSFSGRESPGTATVARAHSPPRDPHITLSDFPLRGSALTTAFSPTPISPSPKVDVSQFIISSSSIVADIFARDASHGRSPPRPTADQRRPEIVTPRAAPQPGFVSPWAQNDSRSPGRIAAMIPGVLGSAASGKIGQPVEGRSPLRKLGVVLDSVRSTVGAVFKRKVVQDEMELKPG